MELFRTMFSCGLRVLLGIGICLSLEGPVSAQDNMSTSLCKWFLFRFGVDCFVVA